jgi:hypothetical protein
MAELLLPFHSDACGQVGGLLSTERKLCQTFPTGWTMSTPSGVDHLIVGIVVVLLASHENSKILYKTVPLQCYVHPLDPL